MAAVRRSTSQSLADAVNVPLGGISYYSEACPLVYSLKTSCISPVGVWAPAPYLFYEMIEFKIITEGSNDHVVTLSDILLRKVLSLVG